MRIIRQNERQAFLDHLAARSVALDADLMRAVGAIVEDVRAHGDKALISYTALFDKIELTQTELRISEEQLSSFAEGVDERVVVALREAIRNVRAFHERQVEESWRLV